MINFLIRTSERPKYFDKCINSILNQKNNIEFKIIVSSDSTSTTKYVIKYPIDVLIEVNRKERRDINHNPYNLYLNYLLKEVISGWIFILDDDDRLNPDIPLGEVFKDLDEDTLYISRMKNKSGLVIPRYLSYSLLPGYTDIGMPCVLFNSKYKNSAKFSDQRGGDYLFINDLYKSIPKVKFINEIVTLLGNDGDLGNRNDFSTD